MSLSRFFIDRPVFAWVIAIVIMLAGGIAALTLPVEQYPNIAPPSVMVNAFYPGADAATLQSSVTQVIEQQLTGLDNLLYFSSSSNADGSVQITATFAAGTNPDIAQVQVQNKVQAAVPLLPSAVQQLGVTVQKVQNNFILVVAIYDDTGRYNNVDISDFLVSHVNDPLSRVPGVQISRDADGEGMNIQVRGLGTDFTKILLNGDQIAVASSGSLDSQNQNREVDLDLLPTEFFTQLTVTGSTMGSRDQLGRLVRFCEQTGARPVIDRVLPLAQARDGFEAMITGDLFGKIVFNP